MTPEDLEQKCVEHEIVGVAPYHLVLAKPTSIGTWTYKLRGPEAEEHHVALQVMQERQRSGWTGTLGFAVFFPLSVKLLRLKSIGI